MAVFAQTLNGMVDGIAGLQAGFREPAVEDHTELFQILLNIRQIAVQGRIEKHAIARIAHKRACAGNQGVDMLFLVPILAAIRW